MVHQIEPSLKDCNKKRAAISCNAYFGAPSGTRTQDPLIKSQLLYQTTNTNSNFRCWPFWVNHRGSNHGPGTHQGHCVQPADRVFRPLLRRLLPDMNSTGRLHHDTCGVAFPAAHTRPDSGIGTVLRSGGRRVAAQFCRNANPNGAPCIVLPWICFWVQKVLTLTLPIEIWELLLTISQQLAPPITFLFRAAFLSSVSVSSLFWT